LELASFDRLAGALKHAVGSADHVEHLRGTIYGQRENY
jgi:hypothetical protein